MRPARENARTPTRELERDVAAAEKTVTGPSMMCPESWMDPEL